MKALKKIRMILLVLIISFPLFLFIILPIFIGPLLNNVNVAKIEKELSNTLLPQNTEIIEIGPYCGNRSGARNSVEIWAGILIHTELSEEEIIAFFDTNRFNDYQMVWHVPEDLTVEYPAPRDFIDRAFSYFNEHGDEFYTGAKKAVGYYIIGGFYKPFTQWDIRGH